MVAEVFLNMEELKSRMNMVFHFASQVSYQSDHLLPVVQASKSLIGVSQDDPPRNLIKWLDNYMNNFKPDHDYELNKHKVDEIGLLSTFQLEELIVEEKKDESKKYLHQLIQVSDPRSIMELVFEISLQRSNKEVLFCWAAFKTIQFMDSNDRIGILFLCLDCLFSNQVQSTQEEETILNLFVYCHSFQIQMTKMVRSNKIISILKKRKSQFSGMKVLSNMIPDILKDLLSHNKETALQTYLSNLHINDITVDHILLLDAIRAGLKYSKKSDGMLQTFMGLC